MAVRVSECYIALVSASVSGSNQCTEYHAHLCYPEYRSEHRYSVAGLYNPHCPGVLPGE